LALLLDVLAKLDEETIHLIVLRTRGLFLTELSHRKAEEEAETVARVQMTMTAMTKASREDVEQEEAALVSEIKKLGAATMVITNRATPALKSSSDLLVEVGIEEPEFVRLAPMAIAAHLLGSAVGLRKGLNPDAPKNLTRAVVLGANGSGAATRRGA